MTFEDLYPQWICSIHFGSYGKCWYPLLTSYINLASGANGNFTYELIQMHKDLVKKFNSQL